MKKTRLNLLFKYPILEAAMQFIFLIAGDVNFRLFDLRACAINLLLLEKDLQLAYNLQPNFEASIRYFSNQFRNLISQRNTGMVQIPYALLVLDEYLPFA